MKMRRALTRESNSTTWYRTLTLERSSRRYAKNAWRNLIEMALFAPSARFQAAALTAMRNGGSLLVFLMHRCVHQVVSSVDIIQPRLVIPFPVDVVL